MQYNDKLTIKVHAPGNIFRVSMQSGGMFPFRQMAVQTQACGARPRCSNNTRTILVKGFVDGKNAGVAVSR